MLVAADDKKANRKLLSDKEYFLLAQEIHNIMYYYDFYQDVIYENDDYNECGICLDYFGKLECIKCKQNICERCLLKINSSALCPYCRNKKTAKPWFVEKQRQQELQRRRKLEIELQRRREIEVLRRREIELQRRQLKQREHREQETQRQKLTYADYYTFPFLQFASDERKKEHDRQFQQLANNMFYRK